MQQTKTIWKWKLVRRIKWQIHQSGVRPYGKVWSDVQIFILTQMFDKRRLFGWLRNWCLDAKDGETWSGFNWWMWKGWGKSESTFKVEWRAENEGKNHRSAKVKQEYRMKDTSWRTRNTVRTEVYVRVAALFGRHLSRVDTACAVSTDSGSKSANSTLYMIHSYNVCVIVVSSKNVLKMATVWTCNRRQSNHIQIQLKDVWTID